MILASIALGGALGAVARYGMSGWVHEHASATFPWGTLAVNVLGCFLLGLAVWSLRVAAVPVPVRGFVTIGLLGAFTTFSTFSFEAVALLQDGEWLRAALYLGASVLLGLLAMLAGLALAGAVIQLRG